MEDGPFTTVYHRDDKEGKLEKIEGWYKDKLLAYIDLAYGPSRKLQSVKGSNEEQINYHYGENGYLSTLNFPAGNLEYKYEDHKVSEIYWDDRLVKHFYYNPQGQLLKEANGSIPELTYQADSSLDGYKFATNSGNQSQIIEYNPSFKP